MATSIQNAQTGVVAAPPTGGHSWFLAPVALALGVAYLPLLYQHGAQIWLRPHYQFFPLALLGSAWLAYSRWQGLGRLSSGSVRPAAVALTCSLLLLAGAIALESSWLAAVSLPITLAALAYSAGGWVLLRAMLPALLLLCVVVPPPLELDRNLILWLQRKTTSWSSAFLDLLGVYHLIAGNVVEVGGQELFVDEACSGVNSLFVIVACTLFVIFHERRPVAWAISLLAAAVAWVLVANVARVVLMTLLKTRYDIDLTTGWKHDAFGLALFAVALGLIWSTDRMLRFFFSPVEDAPAPEEVEAGPKTVLPPGGGLAASWGLLVPAIALAALQAESFATAGVAPVAPPPAKAVEQVSADTLPTDWARWKRRAKDKGFETTTRDPGSYFGEVSKTWIYELGKNTAAFSLDYPFPSWHDLLRCYTGQGWEVVGQEVHPAAEGRPGYVEVELSRPNHRKGYLLFSQFDGRGEALRARPGGAGLSLFRHARTLERWRSRFSRGSNAMEAEPPPVYQAQLFVMTYTPLTTEEREQSRSFFHLGLSKVTPFLTDATR